MATGVIDGVPISTSELPARGVAERAIRPRRSLPSGRAVAGALLVTVSAVGAFTVANGGASTPETSYLVTTRPIDAGEAVSESDFAVVPIDLPGVVDATAREQGVDLGSAVALRDLRPGDLLSGGDLLFAPPAGDQVLTGTHELTIPVPRDHSARSLVPGDRVTVLATLTQPSGASTVVAVEDATVIEWSTGGDGIGATGTGVMTLALTDPTTVMELAHLANQGEITVVRTTRAIADPYPDSFPSSLPAPGPASALATHPEVAPEIHDRQEPIDRNPGADTP